MNTVISDSGKYQEESRVATLDRLVKAALSEEVIFELRHRQQERNTAQRFEGRAFHIEKAKADSPAGLNCV